MVVSASMPVILPLLPPQSIHLPPPSLLSKPSTGWLKTLKASMRNWAVTRSVTRKFFSTDRSEVNSRGPWNELRPMLPMFPHAGRANPGPDGGATAQKSVPVGWPVMVSAPDIGVKYTTSWLTASNEPAPTLNEPFLLGRHGPASATWPHSP